MPLDKLNFPPCPLRITRRGGCDYVWDALRGMWLLCTPEEWVRRHAIGWLAGTLGVPPELIAQEYPVQVNGQPQRADVVALGGDLSPRILVECKAPSVPLDGGVLRQAARYNAVVGAPRIMLTNGLRHLFFEMDENGEYARTNSLVY